MLNTLLIASSALSPHRAFFHRTVARKMQMFELLNGKTTSRVSPAFFTIGKQINYIVADVVEDYSVNYRFSILLRINSDLHKSNKSQENNL